MKYLMLYIVAISCASEASFKETNSRSGKEAKTFSQTENVLSEKQQNQIPSTKPINSCKPNQVESQIPLTLNFIVDVSTSMDQEISILKNRMGEFISSVSNAGIRSIQYSLTLFLDEVTYRSGLVGANKILSYVPQIQLGGHAHNIDLPEAGFAGLMESQRSALSAPAKNIYIVITDDTMHYGGGGYRRADSRHCEVNKLAQALMANSIVLFWANDSGSGYRHNCGRYSTGKKQVLDIMRLNQNVRYMGSEFRSGNLTNDILNLIKVTVQQGC